MKRTDLAVEFAAELKEKDIDLKEEIYFGIKSVCVNVGKQSEKLIGKPAGKYVTMYLDNGENGEGGEVNKENAACVLSHYIKQMLKPVMSWENILVAGMGNEWITPDSLGAKAVHKIPATAHLSSTSEFKELSLRPVAVLEMGVMGQTGIESAEYLHSISKSLFPAAMILIDSLACSDFSRLCRTIQITDTGIAPGSGVGGSRTAVNKYNMETKVIAVGVPTVIDLNSVCSGIKEQMIVTPNNIDVHINKFAEIISMGINTALNPSLSREEINMLLMN